MKKSAKKHDNLNNIIEIIISPDTELNSFENVYSNYTDKIDEILKLILEDESSEDLISEVESFLSIKNLKGSPVNELSQIKSIYGNFGLMLKWHISALSKNVFNSRNNNNYFFEEMVNLGYITEDEMKKVSDDNGNKSKLLLVPNMNELYENFIDLKFLNHAKSKYVNVLYDDEEYITFLDEKKHNDMVSKVIKILDNRNLKISNLDDLNFDNFEFENDDYGEIVNHDQLAMASSAINSLTPDNLNVLFHDKCINLIRKIHTAQPISVVLFGDPSLNNDNTSICIDLTTCHPKLFKKMLQQAFDKSKESDKKTTIYINSLDYLQLIIYEVSFNDIQIENNEFVYVDEFNKEYSVNIDYNILNCSSNKFKNDFLLTPTRTEYTDDDILNC